MIKVHHYTFAPIGVDFRRFVIELNMWTFLLAHVVVFQVNSRKNTKLENYFANVKPLSLSN